MLDYHLDTIAAPATPRGRGGVGIIRISGRKTKQLAQKILGIIPQPRYAHYLPFKDQDGQIIDEGIALFFPGPKSYTGEDILELQGHGGPVVMDQLLQRILQEGVRLANPGEFTERAFLNNKMDLAQAEAVADLIDARSQQAARSAVRSLQGKFSEDIQRTVEQLIHLRMRVEAAIDFPEEEIDFFSDGDIEERMQQTIEHIQSLLHSAKQGSILREGIKIVIAGKPNAGKSSLLNCLSGRDAAIVAEIAGTTRDTLHEYIHLDGMPLHIIDTAGLRESDDPVEQEGMRRAWQEIETADLVLLVTDSVIQGDEIEKDLQLEKIVGGRPCVIIKNKIDLVNETPNKVIQQGRQVISLSAKYYQGIEILKNYLKEFVGFTGSEEGTFIARRRHLDALLRTLKYLKSGMNLLQGNKTPELLAEKLRQAQQALAEITGKFTADDLLGEIFSNFCIGK